MKIQKMNDAIATGIYRTYAQQVQSGDISKYPSAMNNVYPTDIQKSYSQQIQDGEILTYKEAVQ